MYIPTSIQALSDKMDRQHALLETIYSRLDFYMPRDTEPSDDGVCSHSPVASPVTPEFSLATPPKSPTITTTMEPDFDGVASELSISPASQNSNCSFFDDDDGATLSFSPDFLKGIASYVASLSPAMPQVPGDAADDGVTVGLCLPCQPVVQVCLAGAL